MRIRVGVTFSFVAECNCTSYFTVAARLHATFLSTCRLFYPSMHRAMRFAFPSVLIPFGLDGSAHFDCCQGCWLTLKRLHLQCSSASSAFGRPTVCKSIIVQLKQAKHLQCLLVGRVSLFLPLGCPLLLLLFSL